MDTTESLESRLNAALSCLAHQISTTPHGAKRKRKQQLHVRLTLLQQRLSSGSNSWLSFLATRQAEALLKRLNPPAVSPRVKHRAPSIIRTPDLGCPSKVRTAVGPQLRSIFLTLLHERAQITAHSHARRAFKRILAMAFRTKHQRTWHGQTRRRWLDWAHESVHAIAHTYANFRKLGLALPAHTT